MKTLFLNTPSSQKETALILGNTKPLALMAGPCALESRDLALEVASHISDVCQKLHIPFIFKASFDKANRSSVSSKRGMGWEEARPIFQEIRETLNCPVMTDVHHPEQCKAVAEVVDVLQIPAFLCRQTDLLIAAAQTGRPLNIKKGQFLSPEEMPHILHKARSVGNENLMICERGTTFGYHNLVNDMRGLTTLAQTGFPVIFDGTHSVQKPGALDGKSSGERFFVEALCRGAVGVGVAGLFLETHPRPNEAISDGPNMVPLADMKDFLTHIIALDQISKATPYTAFSRGSQVMTSV